MTLQPETPVLDPGRFYSSADLEALSQEDLEELYSACPDKNLYQQALEQVVSGRGAHLEGPAPDALRIAVIDELLIMADQRRPRLPIGTKQGGEVVWGEAPERVRRSLEEELPLAAPHTLDRPKSSGLPLPVTIVAGAVMACILAIILNRAVIQPSLKSASLTSTARALGLQTTTTPTPLALDDLDRPIGQGDDLRKRYPVILQISHPASPDLVFPVQQKEVDIAEWQYAPQTDVASSLLGLSVRPVIGIPYSPSNEVYLKSLVAGDLIRLAMNSGQTLLYHVQFSQRYQRQDSGLFDQHAPGLVLILLADPAPDRLVVIAAPLDIPDMAADASAPVPQGAGYTFSENGLLATVTGVSFSAGVVESPLPPDWSYLLVDLTLTTSDNPVTLDPLAFELHDAGTGARYSAARLTPSLSNHLPLAAQILPARNTLETTIGYLVPRTLDTPQLSMRFNPNALPVLFQLQVAGASPATPFDLQVAILKIEASSALGTPHELVVTARLYNPTSQQIRLDSRALSVVYTPTLAQGQFPIGPSNGPASPTLPLTIPGGQSLDAELHFTWDDSPYAGLTIAGYQYILTLAQTSVP